jgi:hypothetical protein
MSVHRRVPHCFVRKLLCLILTYPSLAGIILQKLPLLPPPPSYLYKEEDMHNDPGGFFAQINSHRQKQAAGAQVRDSLIAA